MKNAHLVGALVITTVFVLGLLYTGLPVLLNASSSQTKIETPKYFANVTLSRTDFHFTADCRSQDLNGRIEIPGFGSELQNATITDATLQNMSDPNSATILLDTKPTLKGVSLLPGDSMDFTATMQLSNPAIESPWTSDFEFIVTVLFYIGEEPPLSVSSSTILQLSLVSTFNTPPISIDLRLSTTDFALPSTQSTLDFDATLEIPPDSSLLTATIMNVALNNGGSYFILDTPPSLVTSILHPSDILSFSGSVQVPDLRPESGVYDLEVVLTLSLIYAHMESELELSVGVWITVAVV